MRKLLNTLFVLSQNRYLALEGETVVVKEENETVGRFPLHNLEGIITFGYSGASPALMGACAKRSISLMFMSGNGRFLASVVGEVAGNVVLRKEQYRISDDASRSASIARNMIIGKVYNTKWVLQRAIRDHSLQVDVQKIKKVSENLDKELMELQKCVSNSEIFGIEGSCASQYFSVFEELVLNNKEEFYFKSRNRRPPLDNINALLSFVYTLLAHDCAGALSSVGLDPYVGFLHQDRPGRISLALDLMEELRAVVGDRFVLTMVNRKEITGKDFITKENGAVILTDEGRKKLLNAWWNRKKEQIKHPYLNEKIEWGLVPYAQALLLARYIRGDLDEYPVFLWK